MAYTRRRAPDGVPILTGDLVLVVRTYRSVAVEALGYATRPIYGLLWRVYERTVAAGAGCHRESQLVTEGAENRNSNESAGRRAEGGGLRCLMRQV